MTITTNNRNSTQAQASASCLVSLDGNDKAKESLTLKRDTNGAPAISETNNGARSRLEENVSNLATTAGSADSCEGLVDSFDHVTFWVGNAKQSAVFYMTQFGFEPYAFRGLETGSRDVACHVVRLNDTILQFVSAVKPNNKELSDFLISHGDAVKDVAFRVSNIESLLKHALDNGAELVAPLEVLAFDTDKDNNVPEAASGCAAAESAGKLAKLITKRATIKTFGDVTHTFIERNYEYESNKFLPGYHKPSLEVCFSVCK